MQRHESLIAQFNEIAYRKVTTIDDYGDENWDVLEKEANALLLKIAKKEGMSEFQFKDWKKNDFRMPAEYRALKESLIASFKNHYKSRKSQPTKSADVAGMSGVDFETHIAAVLREHGFTNIAGTPKTGDQGADLIANRNNRKIVIQAKRHASTVGNKAVQEVLGAIKFYDANEGWVITNSTFTKAAKELAAKNGVKLIDGYDLNRFAEII